MNPIGAGEVDRRLRYLHDLCRPWALTVIVALVGIVQIVVSDGAPRWGYVLLSSLAIGCVVLGGFAINDYLDRGLDRVAHPNRLIPSGRMEPRAMLLFAVSVFLAALAFFAMLDARALIIGMLAILLLVAYTPLKNYYGPLGNVTISAIVALAVVYGFLTGRPSPVEAPLLLLAGGAFFALLSQESVKDVEDMEGERGFRRSIPLLWGTTAAFRLAALFLAIATLLFLGSSLLENRASGWIVTIPLTGYAMALVPMLFKATRDQATLLVRLLKVGFTATLALLLFVYW